MRPAPALDVFTPKKKAVSPETAPRPAAKALQRRGDTGGRFDVFVPVRKPVASLVLDERAAVLGSNNLAHPWACEPADDVTMNQLAHLAGGTLQDLQYRRNPHDADCPERVPVTRRRCHKCPFWKRHPDLTPFDGAPAKWETQLMETGIP